MPRIRLSDALGLEVNGKLTPGANLQSLLPQFAALKDIRLDQIPAEQLRLKLNFDRPLPVSAGSLPLEVGASTGGGITLIRPDRGALDESDPFREIRVDNGEMYVGAGFSIRGRGGASATATSGSLFGIEANREFTLTCYRRFLSQAGSFPRFAEALAETFSAFVLPRSSSDLHDLAPGTVVTMAGSGSIQVSGAFSFATPVHSLASVSLVKEAKLEASAGGSIDVGAELTITSGFQLRLRRTGERKVELGVYRMDSRETALSVSAEAGVSAGVGKFDVGEKLIAALSRQPAVDAAEFRQALPGEDTRARDRRIESFEEQIKGALLRKIQLSVEEAFSRLRSSEAAWLFEIDLDALDAGAATAISTALRGDFRVLTSGPELLPAGITQLVNVLTASDVREHTLRVNLLGLANVLSIGQLAQVSSVERNDRSEITLLTDTWSASRLEALVMNLPGKAKHLRRMLSENFLIEAAYQAANLAVLPPEFRSRHTYFEIHDKTGRAEMKNNLDVARVLALLSPTGEEERLGARSEFGRTTFYAELQYSSAAIRRSFLHEDGTALTELEYETFGRSALGALLAGDPGQELRLRYATLGPAGDGLWAEMKRLGNADVFGPLFGFPLGSKDPRVGAAGSDYFAIVSWASAMHRAAEAVLDVEAITAGTANPESAAFGKARQRLSERMTEVVRDTHEHFGDPLGLVMVYLASNQDAGRRVLLTQNGAVALDAGASPGQFDTARA